MEGKVIEEVIGGAGNLSLWELFLQADIVVKIVMLILIIASIWCWTIIFEKFFLLEPEPNKEESFEEVMKNYWKWIYPWLTTTDHKYIGTLYVLLIS